MLLNNYTRQEYKSSYVIIPSSQNRGALLLGDLNAASDQQLIKEHNIKTIITAACGLQHLKIPSQLTHVVFPLMDTKQQNITTYFEISYSTIQQNLKKGAVLIHCGAGISRSASLIIAYYMKKYDSSFTNAISYVKRIKPNVCPNLGFELQLKNYQNIISQSKTKQKTPSINTGQKKKNSSFSPLYEFEIPLEKQKNIKSRNKSINMNRLSSKMIEEKRNRKAVMNASEFYVEGKNNDYYKKQTEKNITIYEPKKYSYKFSQAERGSFSAVKRPKHQVSIF